MKLLNPGPVTLTNFVRQSLAGPDLCHREPEFAQLTHEVIDMLSKVYSESTQGYTPIVLTGSGTAAVEAMLGSLIPKNAKTLVIANGVYGERGALMLKAQSKPFEIIQGDWVKPIDLKQIEQKLESDSSLTDVFMIHHETTTGRLNPVAEVGKICKRLNRRLYLDAVSSFGGEEIRFEEWNLEACAGTANKCLHGVPGIAFVLARKSIFETRTSAATSVYLDLFRYQQEQKKGFSPFTQSVQVMYAAHAALKELNLQGGWKKRQEQYRKFSQIVRQGLAKMDIGLFLESAEASSCILVSYKMPAQVTYEKLHDELKKVGFIIYAGQGAFNGQIFRISTMGNLEETDMNRLLNEIAKIIGKA